MSPKGCRRFQSVHWFCQTLFRIPAASGHPNSIRMSKSFPFMTCQTALDSLQASALRATMLLRYRFFRSYQDCVGGSKRGANVAASMNAQARCGFPLRRLFSPFFLPLLSRRLCTVRQ